MLGGLVVRVKVTGGSSVGFATSGSAVFDLSREARLGGSHGESAAIVAVQVSQKSGKSIESRIGRMLIKVLQPGSEY